MSAPVKPGGKVDIQWITFPDSHMGPIITYMAKCAGDCATVDKTTLKFFKIDALGRLSAASNHTGGIWANNLMIANNRTYSVTIPKNLAAGNYVIRHEIIGLQVATRYNGNGAQSYPMCINVEVSGSGTNSPPGEYGTELYKATDPGINCNIYDTKLGPDTYPMPGPKLCSGAIATDQPGHPARSIGSNFTSYGGSSGNFSTAKKHGNSTAKLASMKKSGSHFQASKSGTTSQEFSASTQQAPEDAHTSAMPTKSKYKQGVPQPSAASTSRQAQEAPKSPAASTPTSMTTVDQPAPGPYGKPVATLACKCDAQPSAGDGVEDVVDQVLKILQDWVAAHPGVKARGLPKRAGL